ncbi:hypothetical protein [Tenacibaculum maritimum]|uniref:hypothetical protein n=1 Tax=Tenacibaculum maritimum TaxID=107401 RepID=UPI0012E44482|nr:hypothetical protein [Tenacibaculum maritimum]MCD9586235.1 hypothetical protein [Tenacibaculum maritimum]MCD9612156.1 hypothetical protein [Tenacibaculum maritimum]MCD9622197.1 hypothetical protein [Tenacibaculum maritimum]MCD9628521.1 hypothetical protein [Tenacibaculum maritimum]MCD9631553.1 hypothetical protein [Tenacibaculum maritimum]
MDINRLEIDLNNKISKKDKKSFLFKLDRLQTFDMSEFDLILTNLDLLIKKYNDLGKTKLYTIMLKNITLFFQHILFLFYCHYNPNDNYKINNISEIEDITNIYIKIRQISDRIIF